MAAVSAHADTIHTDDGGLVIETATLPSDNFDLPAYVARPKAAGRFPAVIVASEVFEAALTTSRTSAVRIAKLGYVVRSLRRSLSEVADPAPVSDMNEVMKIVMQALDPQVMDDVGAAIRYLQQSPHVVASKIAITGFCYGGGVTWLACEQFPQIAVGVAWYGKMIR